MKRHTEEKEKKWVNKQRRNLSLYKNRALPQAFFVCFYNLEHLTVYATKKAVIVSQAQLFLITCFQHTFAKQHIHFGEFKVYIYIFCLSWFYEVTENGLSWYLLNSELLRFCWWIIVFFLLIKVTIQPTPRVFVIIKTPSNSLCRKIQIFFFSFSVLEYSMSRSADIYL